MIAEGSLLPQTPERRDVINSLSAHASMLLTLEKADRLGAKFWGFPVTWYVTRDVVKHFTIRWTWDCR